MVNNSINAALGAVNQMLDQAAGNYIEKAKQEEETRKIESKKQLNKITDDIDVAMEKTKLLNSLNEIDGNLAAALEDD